MAYEPYDPAIEELRRQASMGAQSFESAAPTTEDILGAPPAPVAPPAVDEEARIRALEELAMKRVSEEVDARAMLASAAREPQPLDPPPEWGEQPAAPRPVAAPTPQAPPVPQAVPQPVASPRAARLAEAEKEAAQRLKSSRWKGLLGALALGVGGRPELVAGLSKQRQEAAREPVRQFYREQKERDVDEAKQKAEAVTAKKAANAQVFQQMLLDVYPGLAEKIGQDTLQRLDPQDKRSMDLLAAAGADVQKLSQAAVERTQEMEDFKSRETFKTDERARLARETQELELKKAALAGGQRLSAAGLGGGERFTGGARLPTSVEEQERAGAPGSTMAMLEREWAVLNKEVPEDVRQAIRQAASHPIGSKTHDRLVRYVQDAADRESRATERLDTKTANARARARAMSVKYSKDLESTGVVKGLEIYGSLEQILDTAKPEDVSLALAIQGGTAERVTPAANRIHQHIKRAMEVDVRDRTGAAIGGNEWADTRDMWGAKRLDNIDSLRRGLGMVLSLTRATKANIDQGNDLGKYWQENHALPPSEEPDQGKLIPLEVIDAHGNVIDRREVKAGDASRYERAVRSRHGNVTVRRLD